MNIEDQNEYPTRIYAEKTEKLQKYLCRLGYLEESDIDGWFGPITAEALHQYMIQLEEKPLASKPWWKSNRGRGMAKTAVGLLVTAIGFFWAGASNIDAAATVDIIYTAAPEIDKAIHLIKEFIELGGALLVALGFGQTAIGAIKAERPLDPTLIATYKGKEIRLPDTKKQIKTEKEKTAADISRDVWLN